MDCTRQVGSLIKRRIALCRRKDTSLPSWTHACTRSEPNESELSTRGSMDDVLVISKDQTEVELFIEKFADAFEVT